VTKINRLRFPAPPLRSPAKAGFRRLGALTLH
jgi:hypothetical protein